MPWRIDVRRDPDGAVVVHIGLGPIGLLLAALLGADALLSPAAVRLAARLFGW